MASINTGDSTTAARSCFLRVRRSSYQGSPRNLIAELKPVPEAFLPLQLTLPLEQGFAQILLGGEQVTRLHQISLEPVVR